MDILYIIYESFMGSMISVFQIAVIVIPLMIVMQYIKNYNFLDRLCALFYPFVRIFGMSRHASLPMFAGFFLGISYGGGLIIQSAREGMLSKRDLYLTVIFLALCHSIIEDNVLFIAIGADPYVLFIGRFVLAVIVTLIISRLWKEKAKKRIRRKQKREKILSHREEF